MNGQTTGAKQIAGEHGVVGPAIARRTLAECFSQVQDPRVVRARRHNLTDILIIAVCAVVCGADSFTEIEDFGRAKEAWLRERLELPNGIPSHDTFRRVFAAIDPKAFEDVFMMWSRGIRDYLQHQMASTGTGSSGNKAHTGNKAHAGRRQVIALDGKSLRHSFDSHSGTGALHLVSAWASDLQLSLAQLKVADKSNEITAIPIVLEMIDIKDCIVTIDAMGCQKEIARKIINEGGDYILALKDNQKHLAERVELFFTDALRNKRFHPCLRRYETLEKDHGRIERRKYHLVDEQSLGEDLTWLDPKKEWVGLKSLGRVESQRTIGDKTTTEVRYFISSISGDVGEFAHSVRSHWGIENSQHWILDIAFREDDCRIRKDHAAENFAVLRKLALNLIKQEKSAKGGVKAKRLLCGWDSDYFATVLAQQCPTTQVCS